MHCLMYARFNKQVEPVQYLMDDLGETPREDMIARYIKHAESKALYWDALEAYKESLIQGGRKIPPVLSGWSPKDTKRPDGRGRPLRWIFRDEKLIPENIKKLEGCGLRIPVKVITDSGLNVISESGQSGHRSERSDAGVGL